MGGWACGSISQPVNEPPSLAETIAAGEKAVATRGCAKCHAGDDGVLQGKRGAPNLTFDATGLLAWTEENIGAALRSGVSIEGNTLCSRMPRFPDMEEEEVKAIAAYLKSLTPVVNKVMPNAMCKPSDANRVTHGEFLVKELSCGGCHSPDLAGKTEPARNSQVYAANLTPDMATGLGSWTPEQVIAAIRTGIDDEGAALCDNMPRFDVTDDGAAGLAAYLKSLAPIAREIPQSSCGVVGEGENGVTHAQLIEQGKQLATDLNCTRCHTADLSGNTMGLRGKPIYPSNLTPDMATGLGSWTEAQIITALRTGVDDEGETLCSSMPRFDTLTDDNAKAIVAFLKSVPAVSKVIPASTCPPPMGDGGSMMVPHDAGVSDAGTVTPPFDAGMPDAGTVTPPFDAGFPMCTGDNVVISQIYGAGGNANAVFSADYVELHNRSMYAVTLAGWALQYASSAGSSWNNGVGVLPTLTIQPGAYVLVQMGNDGANGETLPSGAVTLSRTIDLAAASGKVALTRDAVALSGTCPKSSAIVDFVGYGSANCSMGSAPAPQLSATLAAVREGDGVNNACVQTQVNGDDFAAQMPQPHTGAPNICLCP